MSLTLFQLAKRWARATFALSSHGHVMPSPLPSVVVTTGDQTLIGTSFADVTGLSFSVAASKTYMFSFFVIADADAAGTGIDLAVTAPASPTRLVYSQHLPRAATAMAFNAAVANDTNSANTGSGGTTPCIYQCEGMLVNGVNAGSIVARIKREAVGTGPNVRAGSCGFLWLLN
jgi:hypothetical protein